MKARAPEELDRLALLEQTAAKVRAACEALQRRYLESYDHAELDALERAHKPRAA